MDSFVAAVMVKATGPAADRIAMMQAVLQAFSGEPADESVDVAGTWSERWAQRLQHYLLPRGEASLNELAVLVNDTQKDDAEARRCSCVRQGPSSKLILCQ